MTPRPISRRAVLAGGAGLALLTACGGSSAKGSDAAAGDDVTTAPADEKVLVSLFDGESSLFSGSPQRVTFGVGNSTGALIKDGPATLSMTVTRDGGSPIGPTTVARHEDGLPRAYYPLTFTPQSAGTYEVAAVVDGKKLTSAFAIGQKEALKLPTVGDPMPVLDTPTTADPRGVDPICTREPACPLHAVNLRDALAAKKPTALLVSTPAYCQTAICGPVLDVLLSQQAEFTDITFIHAEVYDTAKDAEANGANAKLAPVVNALGLTFEPALFLIDGNGILVHRLDVIFDKLELRQALPKMLG